MKIIKPKAGDKVQLVSKRSDNWNKSGKMDKLLGSEQIVRRILPLSDDKEYIVIFEDLKTDNWIFTNTAIEKIIVPFNWGEEVEVNDNLDSIWIKCYFVAMNPVNNLYLVTNDCGVSTSWKNCRKIQEVPIELTLEEIADKFDVDVSLLKIKK